MIKVIKGAIPLELCKVNVINMDLLNHALNYPGDPQHPHAFGYYSPIFLESLLLHMLPKIEKATQKTLNPAYSYGRIYFHGSELPRHTDRPSSEWAVTCCLEKHKEWPISFDKDGEVTTIDLDVGDICIYKGIEYPHWREVLDGPRHVQAMLMYVDANGPYVEYTLDKRPHLCHSEPCPPDSHN